MKKQLYILLLFLLPVFAVAQSNLDCSTSTVSACNGTPSFNFYSNTTGSGYGAVMDLPGNTTSSVSNPSTNPASTNSGCLLSGEMNATWVTINISSSGTLEFNISQPGGFEDWAMWPITTPGTSCAQIAADQLAPIRCNWNCSSTGGTGIGTPPAGASACNFEPTLNVTAGQSFIVCVSNYSNINGTISMQFGGTAGTSCVPASAVNSQTICPGASATLSVTTTLGSPSYTWMPGNFNTPTINVSPASTTVYTVNIAGTNTVTSTFTTQVNTGTVTVSQLPTVSLTNGGPYCVGTTGVLTATTNGVSSYTWTGPGGYSATTGSGSNSLTNIQPGSSGIYTVSVKNSLGCLNTATTSLTIISTASVTTTPTISICQGGSFTLTANAAGASSYNWSGPSGFNAANTQNPVINNGLPGQSGTYTATALFVSGTHTCTTTGTTTVTVVPAVVIALTPIPTVCSNGSINLTGPAGANTYTWTGPAGYTSNLQSPIIANATTINQGVYSLDATTNGCTNSGTVSVSVYNALSIPSVASNTVICDQQSTGLYGSGSGGSGSYNYNWSPALALSAPNSSVTIANPATSETYTLSVTDANCPVTTPATALVTVSVNPLPVITFSTTANQGCEPFMTQINSQSTPASLNCLWKFKSGASTMTTSGCNLTSIIFPVHGTYDASLTVTDINGCIDSVSQSNFITVFPKPLPEFDWTPGAPTILTNDVSFTDLSTVGLPMQSWYWHIADYFTTGDKDTSSLQNPTHVFNEVGTYDVMLRVTNQYGCVDSIMKQIIVEDEFVLYIPNAFTPNKPEGLNDVFMVKGMGFLSESFEMRIYDRWGELIYKTNDVYKGWDGSVKGGGKAKQDVYVYKITVKDFKLKERTFVGHVTVL